MLQFASILCINMQTKETSQMYKNSKTNLPDCRSALAIGGVIAELGPTPEP